MTNTLFSASITRIYGISNDDFQYMNRDLMLKCVISVDLFNYCIYLGVVDKCIRISFHFST